MRPGAEFGLIEVSSATAAEVESTATSKAVRFMLLKSTERPCAFI